MSDALALLDALQAATGMSSERSSSSRDVPARLRRLARDTPAWDEQSARPRGAAEPHFNFLIIGHVADDVERAVSSLGLTLPGPVTVGTVNERGLGARTIRPGLDDNSFLIAIDDQFPMFAYLLSKVVAFAVPEPDQRTGYGVLASISCADVNRRAATCPLVGDAFVDFSVSACFEGRPSNAQPLELSAWRQALAASLTLSIERFVVGHEYGHVLGETVPRERRSQLLRLATGGRVVREAWLDELEADAYGAILAILCCEDGSVVETLRAVYLYLHAVHFVDTVRAEAWGPRGLRRSSQTHPPIELRCSEIEAGLRSVLGADCASMIAAEARALSGVLEVLWRRERRRVLRLAYNRAPRLAHGGTSVAALAPT